MEKALFLLLTLVVAASMTGWANAQSSSTVPKSMQKTTPAAQHAMAPQGASSEPQKETGSATNEPGKAKKHHKHNSKKAETKTESQETKEVKPETKPKKSDKKPS